MINHIAGIRPYGGDTKSSPTSKRGCFLLAAIAMICALLASTSRSYAQDKSIIYAFNCWQGLVQNGCVPWDGVIAKDGVLYGVTRAGGITTSEDTVGNGVAYALIPPAAADGPWSETVLYRFHQFGQDSEYPEGPLIAGSGHTLYGVGYGPTGFDIYSLQPPTNGSEAWIKTRIYTFRHGSPYGYLTMDRSGRIVGVNYSDGARCVFPDGLGCGSIFSLSPPATPGGAWTLHRLYSFTGGSDGGGPNSPLLFGKDGVIYGTTVAGGATSNCIRRSRPLPEPAGCGVVFSLTPPTTLDQPWTESVLYSFQGLLDGAVPAGGLAADESGRLFGTAIDELNGGPVNKATEGGTVFELTPPATAGDVWTEHTLWDFSATPNTALGAYDFGNGGVTIANGALYGTTSGDGISIAGTAFKLTPPDTMSGPWTDTILYEFSGVPYGGIPDSGLVLGPGGSLYGTSSLGGILDGGYVYRVAP